MKCRAVSIAVMVLLLGGCSLLGGDIRDRLEQFVTALNASDRGTINSNFNVAPTSLAGMDATWWSANFPASYADHAYGLTLLDYSNPANVVGMLMGPPSFNSDTGMPRNIVLVMSRVGTDWYIEKLSLDGSSTPLIQ